MRTISILLLFATPCFAADAIDLYQSSGPSMTLPSGHTLELKVKKTVEMDAYCIENQQDGKYIGKDGNEYEDCYSAFTAR